MSSLNDVVQSILLDKGRESEQPSSDAISNGEEAKADNGWPQSNGRPRHSPDRDTATSHYFSSHPTSPAFSATRRSTPDTPSTRTGPPRSFSFTYSKTPMLRQNAAEGDIHEPSSDLVDNGDTNDHNAGASPERRRTSSEFRGALEYIDPDQREKEREAAEKRERHRLNRLSEENWNPLKWIVSPPESSREDGDGKSGYFDFLKPDKGKGAADAGKSSEGADRKDTLDSNASPLPQSPQSPQSFLPIQSPTIGSVEEGGFSSSAGPPESSSSQVRSPLSRAKSMPHIKSGQSSRRGSIAPKWNRLRSLLPIVAQQSKESKGAGQAAISAQSVNITDELITGGLSALMLRLWFERDEKGHRRIPILLHRLRVRISDSLHPLGGNQAVFRIECEYANGAARWVVYRQLRDFLRLHTHYRFENAFNRNLDALPEFPRTSLPYFKFLKREGDHDVGRADFAVIQREALENYLIGLVRAVMFHPSANRLAGFLELSALFVSLAQSGGWQAKAGFLRMESVSKSNIGFGRKGKSWTERKKERWCAVRDSYLVAVEEPAELQVWDVFLFDSDFKIERPKRYYRQGLNLFHPDTIKYQIESVAPDRDGTGVKLEQDEHTDRKTISTIGGRIAKFLHMRPQCIGDANLDRHSTTGASIGRVRSNSTVTADDDDDDGDASDIASAHSPGQGVLVDPSTNLDPLAPMNERVNEKNEPIDERSARQKRRKNKDVSKHTFYISNSQMRLKLFAKNERQMLQWITALEKVAYSSHWTGSNRFNSFAPIRLNVAAQWLVDGRDYMWNLSRAILLARERIYIHDWWLSPELLMRRPGKMHYRLDKLLERKAKEGVMIYIILYQEVSSRTTPTDSNYTKQRLVSLHPNIMVQRSPSHFQTGTFYWAHHEKLCVIDEAIAFMGGIDLCFGRWDTAQHVLVDEPGMGEVSETSEHIWPGKDYSNPRVSDFHTLAKPYDDMYDRARTPRMPWHDVGMHVVGQPARDLCRHFVQRWNYLLRIKNHTRQMPFLIPPPDFKATELSAQGLTGTCELQICRSAGPWSLGTPLKVEHSIQNAYLKAIQLSEHFVYIENQFFITSTVVNDVPVENKIGDAIVHRIIRAHKEGTRWQACIIIPLLPGFPYPIDHSDASAVRIILECQNRTICRGPNSIFSRLKKEGINPEDYISVFSLRTWGKLPGNVLTTEMVYLHGKICIVDDRLAIIGSANINERSQRGDRDSELAAIIRDTDLIDGRMAGKPFKVGRFAHTLRVRLMREHLGVDVDAMYEEDLMAASPVKEAHEQDVWDPDHEQHRGIEHSVVQRGASMRKTAMSEIVEETLDSLKQAVHAEAEASARGAGNYARKVGMKMQGVSGSADDKQLTEERMTYDKQGNKVPGFAGSVVPTLEEKIIAEQQKADSLDASSEHNSGNSGSSGQDDPPQARVQDASRQLYGAPANASRDVTTDDEPPRGQGDRSSPSQDEEEAVQARHSVRKHMAAKFGSRNWVLPVPTPEVDPRGFDDPVCDKFWKQTWAACAVHNTEIYRKVFHAIPDDTITTWKQYKEFIQHHERMNKPVSTPVEHVKSEISNYHDHLSKYQVKGSSPPEPVARIPSESGDANAIGQNQGTSVTAEAYKQDMKGVGVTTGVGGATAKAANENGSVYHHPNDPLTNSQSDIHRVPSKSDQPFEQWERDEMEKLLNEVKGHLVIYPNRFLEGEDNANNFLFNADRMLPMPIYD